MRQGNFHLFKCLAGRLPYAPAERMTEQRKLVTIMALDVAGYSRASEKDDSAMAAAVGRLRSVIADAIAPHGGRVFNTAGDGFMIEFSSAISAVAAAQALLAAIAEQALPAVRIGLHLGDLFFRRTMIC
jgi:adenylate cyclase